MIKKIFIAAAACAIAAPAAAAPTVWGGNGHAYEDIGHGANWNTARAAALASTFNGQQGYLVTITSAAENAFIASLTKELAWTGGNDSATEGTWLWADGPEANTVFWTGGPGGSSPTFANWNGGEPNDLFGEDHLHFNWAANGGWNDFNGGGAHGFIVEFGGLRGAVPEPSAWALFIVGFGAVGASLRRSRKVRAALTYA